MGVESAEFMPFEREGDAQNLGDEGPDEGPDEGVGIEPITATLAKSALALEHEDLYLSLCMGEKSGTVIDGGVTDGGVRGDRRFIGQADVRGSRGAGSEIKVGGCSFEREANVEEVELAEERLLLFEDMT